MTRPRLWWFAFCLAVALSGCTATPAALRHIAKPLRLVHKTESLESLLSEIASAPESPAGKSAGQRFMERWDPAFESGPRHIGEWTLEVTSEWKRGYFDALLPAAKYDVRGLEHRITRDGLGVALVGCRENRHREPIETLYPPELITRPVTAVFTVSAGKKITLSLKDPCRHSELAADFSAPLAQLVGKAGRLATLGFGGLTGSREAKRRGSGLFLMEPYDPQKTPVIFVHGLLSTPLTWANVTNDLWGNAEFRRRYQIWHYHYPTSAPFLYTAKAFREQLAKARAQLDPAGKDPASANLQIVAHSMGGLLTRTLITNSGEAAWTKVFQVPPTALKGAAEDRAEVNNILHWKARRDVRHVIFIATPHRGSNMARGFVGWFGDTLTGLPEAFTSLYARIHRDNPEALQPEFRDALSRGKLTSIDTLSPNHPMLPLLNALPFARGVTIHSIIGNRGRKGPLATSSDGVVPYTSSHLDGVASELIVPADHAAYRHPNATAEILRILTGAQSKTVAR